jgi:PKD repeat protein
MVTPVNDAPVASFTYGCIGLICDFDASQSSDVDGAIVTYAWDFGDNDIGSGVISSHTYTVTSTYTVTLTVTDDEGVEDIDIQDVNVQSKVHVGDLDGQAEKLAKGNWKAVVTITVHDANHNPVANAWVVGSLSQGGTDVGMFSCETEVEGTCIVDSGQLPSKKGEATFTVTDVTHATLIYEFTANHDPDGDSNGTSITVIK